MSALLDHILLHAEALWDHAQLRLGRLDVWQWCLFFFPFFLLVELPRYGVPPLVLGFLGLFGRLPQAPSGAGQLLRRQPLVSILLVGHNEAERIVPAIESLLALRYAHREIIVVDDGSVDDTYARAKPYAQRGLIRLFRNRSASGRGGRPSGSNLALAAARGEFVLSVDADCEFDEECLHHLLAAFADPQVGGVAGDLVPLNHHASYWTEMQALEYLLGIGLYRRWLDLWGGNVMASGAFGAFRRSAIEDIGGWDPELAEDADLSTKLRKAGWRIAFAPGATCRTQVPSRLPVLVRQRLRWDRGFIRTFYRKHRDILNPVRYGFRRSGELLMEGLLNVVCSYLLLVYLIVFALHDWRLLLVVLGVSYLVYLPLVLLGTVVARATDAGRGLGWGILCWIPFFPAYHLVLRSVRLTAYTLELLRIAYEDPFLPRPVWRNTARW